MSEALQPMELLTIDDIAELWKVKREYAQRYLVKHPAFPAPAPGSTRKNPRWRERDVQAYLASEEQPA